LLATTRVVVMNVNHPEEGNNSSCQNVHSSVNEDVIL